MKAITHRDSIHGDVQYDPLSVALLNTKALQRLGRIYQLGYAHLVYRGGTHTRLSHVMGASHVAGQLVDLLQGNYSGTKELPEGAIECDYFLPKGKAKAGVSIDARWDVLRYLVRWAALLHDIGHIPLGHTLEDEFEGIYLKHDDFSSPRIPYLWNETTTGEYSEIHRIFINDELLPNPFRLLGIRGEQAWQTVMLICLHKEKDNGTNRICFQNVINNEDEDKNPFIRILKEALKQTVGKTFFPYMADIVGDTICADYLDYLRRDPKNVGLDVLRDDRVASRFYIGKDENELYRMALALVDRRGKPRLDTCTGVIELVRQRFRFAEIIYYHKTKVSASVMLAKAFSLIGKPKEIGPPPMMIEIDKVKELTDGILSQKNNSIKELYIKCYPSALLDTEIGDESLNVWLQGKAWEALLDASNVANQERIEACLRGISLLQSLACRNLYKVCFTIDRKCYGELCPGSKEPYEIERRIQETLKILRNNVINRSNLEKQMATAADWPEDSLLLYVPPRKSQAKGIETGALDGGDVVTLGNHSAVKEEVLRLNEAYKSLWRIILLVHPKYSNDSIGLSCAIDAFIKGLWSNIDMRKAYKTIREASWFHYIPEDQRKAATLYKNFIEPNTPDWLVFEDAILNTSNGTICSEEHSQRALLLSMVVEKGGSAENIKNAFCEPNSLSYHIKEIEEQLTIEGRNGTDEKDKLLSTINRISDEITKKQS